MWLATVRTNLKGAKARIRISSSPNLTSQRGLSIIEILVALMIGAMLFGFSLRAVRSGFESEGRRLVQRVQGTVKYFYNAAALAGNTYRMVFDLEEQVITIEMAEGTFVRKAGSNPFQPVADDDEKKADEEPEESIFDEDDSAEDGDEGASKGPPALVLESPSAVMFGPATGPRGLIKRFVIPSKVSLSEVFVPGRDEPITEGKVYLHCYPGGRVDQMTLVFTNNGEDRYFVLETNPITGMSRVSRKHPREQI